MFTGRADDLRTLDRQLRHVLEGRLTTRGRALIMTGRRRVGKSRLVQEFCDRSGLPYVVFQASRGRSAAAERHDFIEAAGGTAGTTRKWTSSVRTRGRSPSGSTSSGR
jgi:AAA+ ATPase superfamily predicted ATPase